jgi:hypothetical protein
MKKTLAALAIFSGAALSANAAMLKVSDQTFANFGLKLQIYGQSLEDAAKYNNDYKNAIDFTIQNARVYFSGQLNPIVQFGANLDFAVTGKGTSHEATSTTKVRDAFINFRFMPELNVMAGYYRLPFSRETLTGRYDRIFMPQDGWVRVGGAYKDQIIKTLYIAKSKAKVLLTAPNVLGGPSLGNAVAITGTTDEADFARDAGVTIWGDILGGMVKYYVGVYDGFGDHNAAEVVNNAGKDNLGYAFRIQFTPTMLGFQPEKGYLLSETYLGQKNTLSFGLGYAASKLDLGSSSYKFKSWTLDANWEQKLSQFGLPLVPKVELGYVYTDGDNLGLTDTESGNEKAKLDSVKSYYITLGTLLDQQIWLGKLGFYLKYQKTTIKLNKSQLGFSKDKPSVWTVAVPYYLAGQNAKIVLQYNKYDYDKTGLDPRNSNDDSNSDWTLAFQVQF